MPNVRGGTRVEAAFREIARKLSRSVTLRVGFLEDAKYPGGTSVALVAAVHEFGSSRVPPRPFFRPMIAAKKGEWAAGIATQLKRNDYDVQRTLAIVGMAIKGQLQNAILTVTGPPLAPSTVARKGFDTLLIDTSHMLNSIDYDVSAG